MADTDSGGLLVQIGVTQARMERELAKVVKQMADAAKKGEDAFNGANDNIGKGANKAFGALGNGANKATGALKNTSFATANLGSQLNDIGVQLAGGQSPFLIMLQQGTQISQLFNQTGGSIRGFGSILASAVTSVLNPFSLLTFAIIGVGGAAVQYFADMVSGGEDANKVIEDQQKLVAAVAKEWGTAVPALQAYVDTLANAKDAADLIAAGDVLKNNYWALARKEIDDVNVSFVALMQDLRSAGESAETIKVINDAFQTLREKIEAGKATTADMDAVTKALASTVYSEGIPSFLDFGTAVSDFTQTLAGAAAQATKVQEEVLKALSTGKNGPKLGTLSPLFSDNGQFRSQEDFIPSGDTPTPGQDPRRDESLNRDDVYGRPKKSGSSRGANAYKDEVASIKERTAVLRESTAAQAAINPLVDDYGFAAAKAAAEQRLLADAQRAGMTITPQLRDQMSQLATEYASATAEAKQLSESQREIQRNAEEWVNLEKDVLGGFITDLTKGKSAADALADALGKIGNKLLDMALDEGLSIGGTGSGGSGFFSSLLSGFGKIFGYASGTANTGGKRGQPAGIVHGQEAVIPLPAGGKVPVTISAPSASDMAGKAVNTTVEINIPIDATGADAAGLARVEREVRDLKRSLPGTIVATVNDGTRRRLIK
ncbi:phage tail length tape measure family protein [Rhizobium sullae]|uniref:Tail length tape measure protein n=1 Tax=Rhizobium sullae TaxID=50338 RepID=A0A4V2V9X0_RHISU|nr:phage tail length tape measure family protein [Rhizobium sullae]TCU18805.1 tail length tape measure protein [Rhizobium sullae]